MNWIKFDSMNRRNPSMKIIKETVTEADLTCMNIFNINICTEEDIREIII